MTDEPRPLTEDELAALWAEIGREALLAEAMNQSLTEKLRRYDYERERAGNSNVHKFRRRAADPERGDFRPRPSNSGPGIQPPLMRGPDVHGNGGDDTDSSST